MGVGTTLGTAMNLGPTELIIILVIVLVLFGSTRLPKLARSLGAASKEFKEGVAEGHTEEKKDPPQD
jgi:sec-independent protein translocase protein TatA